MSEIESMTLKTYNLIYIMIYLHKYVTNIHKSIFRPIQAVRPKFSKVNFDPVKRIHDLENK